jgi:hypothetical protein
VATADDGGGAVVPPAEAPPSSVPPPPPEPPQPPPAPIVRRYGDRGTSEVGIGLGYSRVVGFVGAGAFRYFVADGIAPGLEATYVSGGAESLSTGLVMAAVRLVPLRTGSYALVLTGRAGRVFFGGHDDGWGAGGAAGVLILLSPTAGIELGYEALRLLPSSFCADLRSCVMHGPVIGVRLAF